MGFGVEGRTLESREPVRDMTEAAWPQAAGAVFPLSWYFLLLVVCQTSGHNDEEANAVCLLRTWDQIKCKCN